MNNEMTTDNMSNEEVIEVLKGIVFNGFDRTTRKERQALHLAIKALEEQAKKGDLISREALKSELELSKYIVPNDLNRLLNSEINRCIEAIDNAPTVDPTYQMPEDYIKNKLDYLRPQGEWIKCGWSIRCSICNYDMPYTVRNFCPNCGASMKDKVEE